MNTAPQNPPNAPDPLAVALSKLDPSPHGFDWNALMFAAGRASKTRVLNFWRAATVLCALAACGFAFAYFTRSPIVVERPVASAPAAPVVPEALPGAPEPVPLPLPTPAPAPSDAPPDAPLEWSYDAVPEQGVAARWLNTRNEVLTVGLTVLPDRGRMAPAPHQK